MDLGAKGFEFEFPGSSCGLSFMINEDETIAQRLGQPYKANTFVRHPLPTHPVLPAVNDPDYGIKSKRFKFQQEIYVVYKDARIYFLRRLLAVFPVLDDLVNATGTFNSDLTVYDGITHIKNQYGDAQLKRIAASKYDAKFSTLIYINTIQGPTGFSKQMERLLQHRFQVINSGFDITEEQMITHALLRFATSGPPEHLLTEIKSK